MLRTVGIMATSVYLFSFSQAFGQVPTCPFVGTATSSSGVIMACPKGDGPTLASKGLTISVRVLNALTSPRQPVVGIPATDMWLIGWHDGLSLCGGSAATHADAATDSDGRTTFSGALAVGGCDDKLYVVIEGNVLATEASNPYGSCYLIEVPIAVRSADMTNDGTVNLSDYSKFITYYQNGTYGDGCADFNGDGAVTLTDFSMFSFHYQPNQPAHHCQ